MCKRSVFRAEQLPKIPPAYFPRLSTVYETISEICKVKHIPDLIQWKTLIAALGLVACISISVFSLCVAGKDRVCSSLIKTMRCLHCLCLAVKQSCYCGDAVASGGCTCMCGHLICFSALCCSACGFQWKILIVLLFCSLDIFSVSVKKRPLKELLLCLVVLCAEFPLHFPGCMHD